ncbi:hypothetical protein DB347_01305 [Opitutaceae bacterium EW11]|nr:hypothetical protein DB347_01305 [Opitutaceae bacterium EW11]
MRTRTLITALLGLATASLAWAGDFRIVRVWPEYRTPDSFLRISEYFTGKENPGSQVYLRTHPDQRGGFYFLTRVANNSGATAGKLELSVITPRSPRPVTYTYNAEFPHGEKVYLVGLTGPDWPDAKEHPVAWKISVRSAEGTELASEQSFLWSKPDKK